MQIEALGLQHEQILEPKLKLLGSNISAFNFANLFLFRKSDKTQVLKTSKYFIKGIFKTQSSFIFPLDPWETLTKDDIEFVLSQADYIYPVDKKDLYLFSDQRFKKIFDRDKCDYLYTKDTFESYKGSHLHGQRNLSLHFQEEYDPEFEPLQLRNFKDAQFILEEWVKKGYGDYLENKEAFENYEALNLKGFIIYVDKVPVSYIFGSPINENTFLILSIKGDTKFKGIYPYTYQLLATHLPNYQFLNLDQDLGIEKLREAKLSYKPIEIIQKWEIQAIKN
jgi:hypothetical protein